MVVMIRPLQSFPPSLDPLALPLRLLPPRAWSPFARVACETSRFADRGWRVRAGLDATRAGNRKRPLDGSFSDSSPSGKRRLCPSPQGMLTIQIPPADDGPGTTGLPSALKSLATLTAAELQVRLK